MASGTFPGSFWRRLLKLVDAELETEASMVIIGGAAIALEYANRHLTRDLVAPPRRPAARRGRPPPTPGHRRARPGPPPSSGRRGRGWPPRPRRAAVRWGSSAPNR